MPVLRSWIVVSCLGLGWLVVGCGKGAGEGSVASASASVSAAPVDTAPTEILFKKGEPKIGSSFEKTNKMTMKLDLTKPKKESTVLVETTVAKYTILATENKVITRVKVFYKEDTKDETKNGKETKEKSPIAGKTYVVEFKDKKLIVRGEDDKPAPAKEAAEVTEDVDNFVGKIDPKKATLPDILIKKGEHVDSLVESFKEMFRTKQGTQFESPSVILKDIRKEGAETIGVFEVKLKAQHAGLTIDLTGLIEVRASDGETVKLQFEGPMGFKPPTEGTGSLVATESFSF